MGFAGFAITLVGGFRQLVWLLILGIFLMLVASALETIVIVIYAVQQGTALISGPARSVTVGGPARGFAESARDMAALAKISNALEGWRVLDRSNVDEAIARAWTHPQWWASFEQRYDLAADPDLSQTTAVAAALYYSHPSPDRLEFWS